MAGKEEVREATVRVLTHTPMQNDITVKNAVLRGPLPCFPSAMLGNFISMSICANPNCKLNPTVTRI